MNNRAFDRVGLRIALVGPPPLLRENVRSALGVYGINVVAEAEETDRVLPLVRSSCADVVLVDLDGPGTAVLEICRPLVRDVGVRGILGMTRRSDDGTLLRSALVAGVRGYVATSAETEEIVGAVRAVAGGSVVVGTTAARLMAELLRAPASHLEQGMPSVLTRRESEILELVARGHDNRHIARLLTLADKTVRNHVSAIFSKIGADNRAQAVVRAREAGFGLVG
ncbi:LuxR C-terminal-related transcriptional regulator [Streptomyces sp. NRRL S-646]|uniref:LuxR C-terminal-related transcriptional regulator n=1 Tax=Streptomyces sp. NRRL S-646 TaxID=1463917 RepID=UPI0004C6981B|nr:response regulator transcription factor [Streptomyces sp. NRRL S-646]